MKVFISWSGERSREVASALRSWIPSVFQSVEPWMSEKDIMGGAMWLNEIMTGLREARFGIVCVTPENQSAPWLHFEAGAIAKEVGANYVCPYLFSLGGPQFLNNPLTNFQYKQANEIGTKGLVESINQIIEKPIQQDTLYKTFALWWPELNKELRGIPELQTKSENKRSSENMLEEVLELVRQISRSLPVIQDVDDTLKMKIHRILRTLSPEEERVLTMLYGLDNEVRYTHQQVGAVLKISANKVRQIEAQALRKLRHQPHIAHHESSDEEEDTSLE